jgi:prephenate dehydrogenase
VFQRVTVVGLGLIGGSLAQNVRKVFPKTHVHGIVRNQKHLNLLKKTVHTFSLLKQINQDPILPISDLVIIATPINQIAEIFKVISKRVNKNTIIVDVGSTKEMIVNQISKLDKDKLFVGGHPMAGSDKVGLENAKVDLFNNKVFVITPGSSTNRSKVKKLTQFVKKLGMRPVVMSPSAHDEAVAAISHLPFYAASAVVGSVLNSRTKKAKEFLASSGFRDTTRVAGGPASWGAEIAQQNKKFLLENINSLKKELASLEQLIRSGNSKALEKKLNGISQYRNGFKF